MRRRLRLAPQARRSTREPVVPMINIVFLLLIFFLMTAQIAPPVPFDVSLPSAEGEEETGTSNLFISAEGLIAFDTLRGEAALAESVRVAGTDVVRLNVDASQTAATLAQVLAQLAALGATGVEIVTEGR
ncbi:ExbD/TolR family protein [Marivita hallyeonensis]|uniref:Outer membrane transport energization protein ExbD n=1 Tax=Marivita hallyeonensis TaxID=996342 RepID=A0A1M5P9V8_9RHOB|nr:biopolymer transporter ExbD [Marivita hallyeonensis]SHG98550.1 outer membrane transport energization protein ExbD [Marivita hallyeonensis]